jgi:hypothetical protein
MQKRFLQDIMLFVIKGFLPLRIVEFVWFQRLVLQLYPKVSFLSKKVFTEEVFPTLVNKALTKFMQLALAICLTTTYNFDLWMCKGVRDVFVVVVNFLFAAWKPKHIMIGLSEASDTSGVAMAMTLKQILHKFGLCQGRRLQPINLCSSF